MTWGPFVSTVCKNANSEVDINEDLYKVNVSQGPLLVELLPSMYNAPGSNLSPAPPKKILYCDSLASTVSEKCKCVLLVVPLVALPLFFFFFELL